MNTVTFPEVVSRGCGIDVHKKVVVATIDGSGLRKETREFDTFTRSLTELKDWLLANEITHVAMESTGVYPKSVIRILGRIFFKISIKEIKPRAFVMVLSNAPTINSFSKEKVFSFSKPLLNRFIKSI